jgi:hypothetical protein
VASPAYITWLGNRTDPADQPWMVMPDEPTWVGGDHRVVCVVERNAGADSYPAGWQGQPMGV